MRVGKERIKERVGVKGEIIGECFFFFQAEDGIRDISV